MISTLASDIQIERFFWARPVPLLAIIAALFAVVVLTVYLYRRPMGLSKPLRLTLGAIRFVVLCLILAILLEPTLTVEQTQETRRRMPVLIDVSESMSVRDPRKTPEQLIEAATALGLVPLRQSSESPDPATASLALDNKQRQAIAAASRLELSTRLLSDPGRKTLASIGEDIDINYYAFGKSLQTLGEGQRDGQGGTANPLTALQAVAPGTSIAHSLEAVANTDRDTPLAGIVVLTDGLETSHRRMDAAVNELGLNGVPVYAVPIGVADPDDVAIRSVIMQEVAFSGDKVPIRVQVRSKGYEKRTANLTVRLNDRGVAERTITLEGGLQFEDIFFNVDVHEQGAARIEVSIEPFADESTAKNNRVERSVRVVNEKINVLCMEGSARWEYRYLRAMLKRDPRINATFIATRGRAELARSSSEYIARFPELREDAFQYDLVILGDVDSAFFTAGEFTRLEELIKERGGSLLVLCGSRFTPTSYADTPVQRMLPVRFDPDGDWQEVDDTVYPALTAEGRSSLVMTLEADQEENDRVWSRVAPMDRVPPLFEAKPGATVLAKLSDGGALGEDYPLVSWQRYGAGKCMAIATDRLWLLRFKSGDKYHWRVWSQCIQFLTLSRLMGEHKRIRLETDRTTYSTGGQVLLYAHVLDDEFNPVNQAGFEVVISAVDASSAVPQRITLRPDLTNPGLYEGYFTPSAPGRYRMEAGAMDRELANATEFQVADINTEMANTDMQVHRLQQIADLTGGQVLSISDFQSLSTLIDRSPHTTTVRTDRPLWDNGWIAFLLVGLLGIEWLVRRKYDIP